MSVAGIQGIEWFGNDVWTAGEYIFLHSGRPLPDTDKIGVRNEGVGIALDKAVAEAWKKAGEVWEAVSSRVVMARVLLKIREKMAWKTKDLCDRCLCLCPYCKGST